MSIRTLLLQNAIKVSSKSFFPAVTCTRNGHMMRGKPPGVARTLEQRLQEENPMDKEIAEQINIGFPSLRSSLSEQRKIRVAHVKSQRSNEELEKKSRSGELLINLEEVVKDSQSTTAPHQLKKIADHFGIFRDLYKDAYFVPRVFLDIKFQVNDKQVPVYNGNVIEPLDAKSAPLVNFDGTVDPITKEKLTESTYWTLLATNPDCHLTGGEKEFVHWFVSNIPNGNTTNGETVVPFVQPFPPKGTGYQRFVFVLYKQNRKLDFSEFKVSSKIERPFSTREFYKKFQEDITPAGLSFFQTCWDASLTDFYHKSLEIKEPTYEYNFPAPYRADQKWFPLKQPFNLYMDKYRDPKKLNQDYLEKKLAKTHPFDGPEPSLRYPMAHYIPSSTPSWLKVEIKKERQGIGRISKFAD